MTRMMTMTKVKEMPVKKKPRTDARLRLMIALMLLTYFPIVGTPGIKEKWKNDGDELRGSS